RSIAHTRGLQLARAQTAAVKAAGGIPIPIHHLAPHFRAMPDAMFSADGFHPSPTAYALAAQQLLFALCDALGEKIEGPRPQLPPPPDAPEVDDAHNRPSGVSRLWRRPSPAPFV